MDSREFVAGIFNAYRDTPEEMDITQAKEDLEAFRKYWDNVPEDITPEEYMEIWNEYTRFTNGK